MSQREQTNYYEILEIAPDAMATEIHKAYQRARQTYSADNPALYSMFSPDEARELLRLIDEAYNVLGNQATRKTYDETLSMPKGARGTSLAPELQSFKIRRRLQWRQCLRWLSMPGSRKLR